MVQDTTDKNVFINSEATLEDKGGIRYIRKRHLLKLCLQKNLKRISFVKRYIFSLKIVQQSKLSNSRMLKKPKIRSGSHNF